MKKLYISFILIFIMFAFSSRVFADYDGIENIKIRQAINTAGSEWLDTFKNEETPIEKRITSYELAGYGISYDENGELDVSINFNVTPYSEENTVWETKGNNIGFIKFKKVNGEYEVERISEIPENYDKFLEKFEEYKSKHPDILENNTQTQSIAGKEDNYNANETIEKISNGVFTVSLIVGIIVGIIIILTICKKKIKNAGK